MKQVKSQSLCQLINVTLAFRNPQLLQLTEVLKEFWKWEIWKGKLGIGFTKKKNSAWIPNHTFTFNSHFCTDIAYTPNFENNITFRVLGEVSINKFPLSVI